jgi:hypothetical protein
MRKVAKIIAGLIFATIAFLALPSLISRTIKELELF